METEDSVHDEYQNFKDEINQTYDVSSLVIPFSKLFKSFKPADIYSGDEKIPFKERDPEYRMILRQEFANVFKKEI